MACSFHMMKIFLKKNSFGLTNRLSLMAMSSDIQKTVRHIHFWTERIYQFSHLQKTSKVCSNIMYNPFTNSNNVMLYSSFKKSLKGQSSENTDKNIKEQFQESSECLVFDKTDILIKKCLFKEAQVLANEKNSRLVYLSKNKDGLGCFKLQPSVTNENVSIKIVTNNNSSTQKTVKEENSKRKSESATTKTPINNNQVNVEEEKTKRKKENELSIKEFKINSIIKEHDLLIKTTKMKTLLAKGTPVKIVIMHKDQENDLLASTIAKKFTEELKSMATVHPEPSGKSKTQLLVKPINKQTS